MGGSDIIGEGNESLERWVGERLRQKGFSLSTAESCTGGSVAARLTAIAGSSDYFKGAVVAYANEIKMRLLQVPADMLDTHGAVSEEVVRAMADGAKMMLNTDCSIAVSGIAGPGGGTPEQPVGTVLIAVSVHDKTFVV